MLLGSQCRRAAGVGYHLREVAPGRRDKRAQHARRQFRTVTGGGHDAKHEAVSVSVLAAFAHQEYAGAQVGVLLAQLVTTVQVSLRHDVGLQ